MSKLYDFVGYDSAQTMEEAIAVFEEEAEEELYAGDERLMLLQSFGYMVDVVMAEINYRANNNIIKYCDEENLYLYAESRCVTRTEAEYATVTVKFQISAAVNEPIVIAKGTRVTQEGTLFFETQEEAVIAAGSTSVTVECIATDGGSEYNGIEAGKLTVLADTIPYITAVSNTTVSAGGTDQEELKAFRERVINAPKGFSTAGADLAYIAKVKEVDTSITDVCPIYDETNKVLNIYVLCENGALPDSSLLLKIRNHIYQKNIKASTDNVEILAAVQKNYTITCSYKISQGDSDRESEIGENVESAINAYVSELSSGMGIAINPELLKKYIYNAGAATAEVTAPEYTSINDNEVAICTAKTVTYSGQL